MKALTNCHNACDFIYNSSGCTTFALDYQMDSKAGSVFSAKCSLYKEVFPKFPSL